MKKTFLLAGIAAALATSANANTITPSPVPGSFIPGVSITYQAKLSSGEIHAGDGFTIFDIGGFTGFGAISPLWTASSSVFGSPWGLAPLSPDTADINVTFTYIGPNFESDGLVVPDFFYLPFVVLTTSTTIVTDSWVSRDHLIGTAGVIDGVLGPGDRGNILVPGHVPDGGTTVMLLGAGLSALGLIRRKLA